MDETTVTVWWSISGAALLKALRQVASGDSPDVVYMELLVNSQTEEVEGEEG
jgi:hypothetical protein